MFIFSVFEPFANHLKSWGSQFSNTIEWKGYHVQWLKDFSKNLYDQFNLTASLFIVVNILFFAKINEVAQILEEKIKTLPKKLDAREIRFNMILIDYVVVGGSILAFNAIFSKLMTYPLSKLTLAIITLSSVILRFFSHQPQVEIAHKHKKNKQPLSP